MPITINPTQVANSLALLLVQFKGMASIEGLLTSYANQIQILENVWIDMLSHRGITTGAGEQLDAIGRIVLLNRGGLSDADYKLALVRQTKINASKGSSPEILDILSSFDDYGFTFDYRESAVNADFDFEATQPILFGPDLVTAALAAKAAGVKVGIEFPSSGSHYFSFGPDPDANGESIGLDSNGGFIAGGSDDAFPGYPIPLIQTVANVPATHGVAGSHDFKPSIDWPYDFALLTFSITGALPAGFSFNNATGVLSWTTALAITTTAHTITAQYARSSLQTSNSFALAVT